MPERIVLFVDDEAILLLALKIQLRSLLSPEYTCETALSAESALKQIEDFSAGGQRLAAVVSDWRMPGMKGDEFLRRVRAIRPSCCLILMTGYAENAAVQTLSAELGLAATFQKPCDTKALAAAILKHAGN